MTTETISSRRYRLAAVAIIVVAIGARLVGIGFGLPSALDPDEPLFLLLGFKLLAGPTLDPGWFGHPGTTTIYVCAIVEAAVFGFQRATGMVDSARAFALAFFQDPSAVFIPTRLVFAAFGVGCVFWTWRIARTLWGPATGLIAALLLALNPLHIAWSQVIRTDVQASFFLLLCLERCIAIARGGRARDRAWAAIWAGAAIATKWPAATVLLAVVAATMLAQGLPVRRRVIAAGGTVACAALALLAISPFLVLDHATAASNLSGEAQVSHLGATGGPWWWDLGWYVSGPLFESFGLPALMATAIGIAAIVRRDRVAAATVLLALVAFVAAICTQRLVWVRWIVPVLPLVALLAAAGIVAVAQMVRTLRTGWNGPVVLAALTLVAIVPIGIAAVGGARERLTDTRTLAESYVRRHAAPGSVILVEYPALALLTAPFDFRYPGGAIGCIEGRATLAGTVKVPAVDAMRGGRAILDIGTIAPERLSACTADIAIFSDYDRYLAEAARYPAELAVYRKLLAEGRTLAIFSPVSGRIGGPTVRVVARRHVTEQR